MMKIIMKTGAFALLLLAACTRENPADTGSAELIATFADAATRTSYSYNAGTNFSWDDGDQIAILTTGDDILTGTLTPYTDRTRAKVTLSEEGTRGKIAFYPFDRYVDWEFMSGSFSTLVFTLQDEYDISSESAEWSPLPLYAVNNDSDNKLLFRHLCALLRINCVNVPINTKYIKVSLNDDDRDLTGKVYDILDFSDYSTVIYNVTLPGKEVVYQISSAPIASANTFTLNVPLVTDYYGKSYDSFTITSLQSDKTTKTAEKQLNASISEAHPGDGYMANVDFTPLLDPGY